VKSLRVPASGIDLSRVATDSTPGVRGGKKHAANEQDKLAVRLADLQEKLYADGRSGGTRSLLLVLQGLDTSGKSGTVKHVIGQIDPQGSEVTAFKPPSAEERRHDFLWRIKRRLPRPGLIGVFDRSHYEDVVAVRVRKVVPRSAWSRRFDTINRFEYDLAVAGTTVIKCFLHISFDEWRERQLARLDDPSKRWKFNPGDIDDALLWDDYLVAYGDALERCNADTAPWYVVPADHKWYRNHAVTKILIEHLEAMDLRWPGVTFDVQEQRVRLNGLGRPADTGRE
jgi:PPK2 family polyphosphate:nucleotide phosphotransferase